MQSIAARAVIRLISVADELDMWHEVERNVVRARIEYELLGYQSPQTRDQPPVYGCVPKEPRYARLYVAPHPQGSGRS